MKYLQLQVTHSVGSLHPMHAYEISHDDLHGSELLYWNPRLGETNALVFRVWGDPHAYRERLDDRDETLDYSIALGKRGTFYCCVRERLTARDESYVDAFAQETVVVVPPIRYNQDRTIDVTVVGTPSDIELLLSEFPETDAIEVVSVGDYRTRAAREAGALTPRQQEAVEAAVDYGYYSSPREGTVGDVAAELAISTSTAAEHLRKAESTLMARAVDYT